jgi:hypothetical protein
VLGAIHRARAKGLQASNGSDRRRETIAELLREHRDELTSWECAELAAKALAGRLKLSKRLVSPKSVRASALSESYRLGRGFWALRRTSINLGMDGVDTFRGR